MRISDWSSDVCSSDLADRLLLRPAARPGNAGDRDRDVGIAVREHARRHRPGGCERYFAEGFEDFAADIELRLFGVPGISDETRGKYVRTAGDVGQRGADRKSTRMNSSH